MVTLVLFEVGAQWKDFYFQTKDTEVWHWICIEEGPHITLENYKLFNKQ